MCVELDSWEEQAIMFGCQGGFSTEGRTASIIGIITLNVNLPHMHVPNPFAHKITLYPPRFNVGGPAVRSCRRLKF